MSRLAPSGREAVRALERLGFRLVRIEGSHHILAKTGHPTVVVVPVHAKRTLKPGTLAGILRQAGVTRARMADLL